MLNYLKRFIPCNDDPINKLLFDICSQLEIKRYVRYEPVTDHFYIPLDILTGVLGIRISRMYGFVFIIRLIMETLLIQEHQIANMQQQRNNAECSPNHPRLSSETGNE